MKKIKIAYQGVEGAYSLMAAQDVFKNTEFVGLKTFEDVFMGVEQSAYDVAFVPVKNSFAGKLYGLHKLATNIESMDNNITTFYALCREDEFELKNINNFIKNT